MIHVAVFDSYQTVTATKTASSMNLTIEIFTFYGTEMFIRCQGKVVVIWVCTLNAFSSVNQNRFPHYVWSMKNQKDGLSLFVFK